MMAQYPPNQPGQSGQPNQPNQPNQSGQPPYQLGPPNQPAQPGQLGQPRQQGYPGPQQPGQPGQQGQLGQQRQPYQLGSQGQQYQPGQQGPPYQPGYSGQQYQPGQPGQPPYQPGYPGQQYQLGQQYQTNQPRQGFKLDKTKKIIIAIAGGALVLIIALVFLLESRSNQDAIMGLWKVDMDRSPVINVLAAVSGQDVYFEFTKSEMIIKLADSTILVTSKAQYSEDEQDLYIYDVDKGYKEGDVGMKIRFVNEDEVLIYAEDMVFAALYRAD